MTSLKQRIIGAIVLIALAIIFLPILLNNAQNKQPALNKMTARPAKPIIKFIKAKDIADNNIQVIQATPSINNQTSVAKENMPSLAKGQAWVVQLGAFSSESNANKLLARLRQQKFPVYLHYNNAMYHVYVGPETDRSKAQVLLKTIKDKTMLQGQIIHYQPLKP
ncbi:MAG: SPOR domain-containing protein [Gammaproteobacteria bacterium]|nr:SPOR domain-containing protein [Gammaproteobacteria bacterium]